MTISIPQVTDVKRNFSNNKKKIAVFYDTHRQSYPYCTYTRVK